MSLDFLPFSRPSIGEDEIAAVEQVLRSGWITTGPKNQELEQRFAERSAAATRWRYPRPPAPCTSPCWRWASAPATK